MSIRKRTWLTRAGEAKTAWVVDYSDPGGIRRQKTFHRKKEADAWAASTAVAVRQGTHTADSASISVAEAAKLWLRRVEADGRERSTVRQYRQHVRDHVTPHIGNVKLSQLTTPVVEAYRDTLLQSLSKPLARAVLASLKALIGEAQRRGLTATNPARPVSVRIEGRQKRKLQVGVDVPTTDEVRLILATAAGRWRPLLIVAAFTGLRASELRGLRWHDVDLDKAVLHVRQRADRWNAIGRPKSEAGERTVPLAPVVVSTLREWRLACPNGEAGLVFPNGSGNVESLSNIHRRGIGAVQMAAGIVDGDGRPKYGMHALRHFCASWWIGQGFQAKRLQQMLGHASVTMTFDRYGHWLQDDADDHARLAAGEQAIIGSEGITPRIRATQTRHGVVKPLTNNGIRAES